MPTAARTALGGARCGAQRSLVRNAGAHAQERGRSTGVPDQLSHESGANSTPLHDSRKRPNATCSLLSPLVSQPPPPCRGPRVAATAVSSASPSPPCGAPRSISAGRARCTGWTGRAAAAAAPGDNPEA
eukprot:357399-Chlamydomonas_euryale.AAC.2